MDEFLNDPNPKIFDPDNLVTASEPFDIDEFVNIIHSGRDEGGTESPDCWSWTPALYFTSSRKTAEPRTTSSRLKEAVR